MLHKSVTRAAIRIHRQYGSKQQVETYLNSLCKILDQARISYVRRHRIPSLGSDELLPQGDFVDILVSARTIIEVRSLTRLLPIHMAQVRAYLRAGDWDTAILINFGAQNIGEGLYHITRNSVACMALRA